MLRFYKATDVGLVRTANEDNLACFEPDVYVVADGMGGHAGGEIASGILTDVVRRELETRYTIGKQELCDALSCANMEIIRTATDNADLAGMGTTATLVHIAGDVLFWAHVGDSRFYLFRAGNLQQVTRDHSYVEELVAKGTITRQEARVHPKRNLLTRAVGVATPLHIDTGTINLQTGDLVLLATDGLMKMVSDADIAQILGDNSGDLAQRLVQKALSNGGTDNITAIVVYAL